MVPAGGPCRPDWNLMGEEEEEEEGLFKADAVNEEDPERDRAATQVTGPAELRSRGRLTPVSQCSCTVISCGSVGLSQ